MSDTRCHKATGALSRPAEVMRPASTRRMPAQTKVDPVGAVTLRPSGTINSSCVPDFERALSAGRALNQPVIVDLSLVRLIDRPMLQYLADLMQSDVQLIICPDYIERWILHGGLNDIEE